MVSPISLASIGPSTVSNIAIVALLLMGPALSNARALDHFHFFYHANDAPQAILSRINDWTISHAFYSLG
jgi:hypothetical protein